MHLKKKQEVSKNVSSVRKLLLSFLNFRAVLMLTTRLYNNLFLLVGIFNQSGSPAKKTIQISKGIFRSANSINSSSFHM